MAKILITGGSGLLGRAISERLIQKGHRVAWLSRHPMQVQNIEVFTWDPIKQTLQDGAFTDIDTVIHLAGSGITDKRWTDKRKQELIDSRVESSAFIWNQILKNKAPVKRFIGASAIGIYGCGFSEDTFTENSVGPIDFLSTTCIKWEKSYAPITAAGISTCVIRIGIVLSKDGGAFPVMSAPFKYGMGSPLGKGSQYFPWIHIHDLASAFAFAVDQPNMTGAYNAVSNEFLTNREFSRQLAKQLHKPFFLPAVPEWFLKLLLGERVLAICRGVKVSPQKLLDQGFTFEYSKCEEALKDLTS